MSKGIITEGEVTNVRSLKDRTVRITFDLQELEAGKLAEIFSFINIHSKVYISKENITTDEIEIIDSLELDHESKSQAQRLRNVLYRYWEQDNLGYKDSELHYRWHMEQIISHYKNKLV